MIFIFYFLFHKPKLIRAHFIPIICLSLTILIFCRHKAKNIILLNTLRREASKDALNYLPQNTEVHVHLIHHVLYILYMLYCSVYRQKKILRNKLCQARVHLLTTFHLIVSHTCLQPVLDAIR